MLCVKEAIYEGAYNIRLLFNNGEEGIANLKRTIFNDKRPIFSQLKEESNFTQFRIEHSTVIWFNELDLAPEYLFYLAFQEDEKYQDKFREWGYIA